MQNVKYDDTGLVTSYLLFTLIFPITIYQCYKLAFKFNSRRCKCRNCISKPRIVTGWRFFITSILVIICAYLTKNIITIKIKSKTHKFDPWKVLGITNDISSEDIIRKAYMKKMRKLKNKSNKVINDISNNDISNNTIKNHKENPYEKEIIDLNNAYSILNDFEEYEKWESKLIEEKSVIAVPEIITRFRNYSIGLYLFILIAICKFCMWKYRRFIIQSNFGINFKSIERFYEKMDCFIDDPNILIVELLIFISRNEEFTKQKWKQSLAQNQNRSIKSILMVSKEEEYRRIWSYLARDGLGCIKDEAYIKKKMLETVNAYIKIAGFCQKKKLFEGLLLLRQMIVQAVCIAELFMEQLPVTTDVAMQLGAKCKKSIDGMAQEIEKVLSKQELNEAKSVLAKIPRMRITDVRAFILDMAVNSEEHMLEVPGEIVRREKANTFLVESNALVKIRLKLCIDEGEEMVHSPFGGGDELKNSWVVYLKSSNTLFSPIMEIDEQEKEIEFSLNGLNKFTELQIAAVNNGYMGINYESSIYIKCAN